MTNARVWMALIGAAAVAGCEITVVKDTTDTGGPGTTGTATGTGTGSTATMETDCTDGIDNDMDGLLDCEDDECAADPACFESDCADGADNDGDGLADCEDEDCWGNGCEATIATITSLGSVQATIDWVTISGVGSSCNTYNTNFAEDIWVNSPAGTVRHIPASGGSWTTCDWSAQSSGITLTSPSGFYNAQPAWRNGFNVDSGCMFQTSGFLPQNLIVDLYPGVGSNVALSAPDGNVWFSWDQYNNYSASWQSDSTVFPGVPCSTRLSTSSYFGTFNSAFGGDYTVVTAGGTGTGSTTVTGTATGTGTGTGSTTP